LNLNGGQAYVGFTAGAAGGGENSDILSWDFSSPGVSGFLSFPLRGMSPGVNQNLTPQTAQINTAFDHLMLEATGHFSIYGCDKQVEDFAGEIGNVKPSPFHVLCRRGYQNVQSGFKFLQNVANPLCCNYSGNPYLYYDGHPGFDFQSGFGNQVYAAASGTVSYPTTSQLSAAGLYVGGNPDVYNAMELDAGNGYKIFHLHLSTHSRNIATQQPLTVDLTGQNFVATKTGKPGTRTPGTLPAPSPLSISGQVTLNGQPLPGVQVNINSSVKLGANGQPPTTGCTASAKTDINGNYMFVGLPSGYYYNLYISPTKGYTFGARNPVFEVPDGAHVNAGDLIALSGNAGPCMPSHLHFEVQQKTSKPVTMYLPNLHTIQLNYVPVDPYGWSPTNPGLQDPYILIPELLGSGVADIYIWK
jgi:murein DD-endopeptidase MepM/ murein hydrolase activator NlpD